MDINQLEVLVAVAREKSFSRAAESLNRTQPAISQAIRRLEHEIGEKLFDRSSKDGTLTTAGEVLVDYAKQMLNVRSNARLAIKELRDLHQGKVTISANEHTVFFLLPIIRKFRERHPMIKVEISRGVASRIPTEVIAREVELGIISFKPKDEYVKSFPVITDELVLIVSPEHALAKNTNIGIRDLAVETFIAHNAQSPYRDKVIQAFDKYKTKLSIGIELPSLEAIKILVRQGTGVALVPRLTAQEEISSGRLIAITVNELRLERRLHIIYRRNSELSNAARVFLQVLKDVYK